MKHAPIFGEHDDEPVFGLPEQLPETEQMLWQGQPNWWGLALRVFHVRKVAVYFAILLTWSIVSSVHDGATVMQAISQSGIGLLIGLTAIALLVVLAILYARTTVYTITSERLVMRVGLALTLTVNLPLKLVKNANLRTCRDRTGDIPIEFTGDHFVSYIYLWPFVRPWKLARPQPMLRALNDPETVSKILVSAIQGRPVKAARTVPVVEKETTLAGAPAPAE